MADVATALIAGTDPLFIRISAWDDYQKIRNFLLRPPATVKQLLDCKC